MCDKDNIHFFIDEQPNAENDSKELDFTEIYNKLDNFTLQSDNDDSMLASCVLNYEVNYNVKQLLLICEYYKIAKELRANKCNKTDIINYIVLFENDPDNFEIMLKRKQLWFYINEIKNDKFMKKYVLWN